VCVSLIRIFFFFFFCNLLFCSNCPLSTLLERKVARVVLSYKRRRKRLLDGRGVYLVHFFVLHCGREGC
jgi:hypothetical protein